MTQFIGKFEPPLFTTEDLDEIESRLQDEYEYEGITAEESGAAKVYISHLCRVIRSESNLDRNDWHGFREWSRGISDKAQQLKKDMFRLIKAVQVSDED